MTLLNTLHKEGGKGDGDNMGITPILIIRAVVNRFSPYGIYLTILKKFLDFSKTYRLYGKARKGHPHHDRL